MAHAKPSNGPRSEPAEVAVGVEGVLKSLHLEGVKNQTALGLVLAYGPILVLDCRELLDFVVFKRHKPHIPAPNDLQTLS